MHVNGNKEIGHEREVRIVGRGARNIQIGQQTCEAELVSSGAQKSCTRLCGLVVVPGTRDALQDLRNAGSGLGVPSTAGLVANSVRLLYVF